MNVGIAHQIPLCLFFHGPKFIILRPGLCRQILECRGAMVCQCGADCRIRTEASFIYIEIIYIPYKLQFPKEHFKYFPQNRYTECCKRKDTKVLETGSAAAEVA